MQRVYISIGVGPNSRPDSRGRSGVTPYGPLSNMCGVWGKARGFYNLLWSFLLQVVEVLQFALFKGFIIQLSLGIPCVVLACLASPPA